ncbi:MAG: gluconate 2-dehydrogenase subunit 3 family protein [Steroidobacteraceae bacterium]
MHKTTNTRRQFLAAGTTFASTGWLALNWPQIVAAAEHADHASHAVGTAPTSFTTLSAVEATEIDAIANQIVPGGATPGARAARVIHFIDLALGSFFAGELPAFRKGFEEFQSAYAAHSSTDAPFSAAGDARQIAWLHEVERTPFFTSVRRLSLLGLIASPKYGGNFEKAGWKLVGFEDRHVWAPPFGHYDIDYPGFDPYPGTKPYTA